MQKRQTLLIILIFAAIGIKLFSLFPDAVEKYYSGGIYPFIAKTQRLLFGWIPFSIGDIFYAAVFIYGLYKLYDVIRRLIKRKTGR